MPVNSSVVICTHNPNLEYLQKVLDALKRQTLSITEWELLLIDNNSTIPLSTIIDLTWQPNSKIIIEDKLGLVHARMTGALKANGKVLFFVDDDNILAANYLEIASNFHINNPQVGAFGGKSLPIYEIPPPYWFAELGINLGCGEHGEELIVSDYKKVSYAVYDYPAYAPIGTGMVILAAAFTIYLNNEHLLKTTLGRKGSSLASGEDNDIILTIIKAGYEIAYVPKLVVHHLIPEKRLTFNYLKKMSYASNKTWVKVLHMHNINPWAKITMWGIMPRKTLSYFKFKAFKTKSNYIKWRGACGMYEALAEIK